MRKETERRILAVDPISRGVGFAVLEGQDNLVDWGIPTTGRADNGKSARVIANGSTVSGPTFSCSNIGSLPDRGVVAG